MDAQRSATDPMVDARSDPWLGVNPLEPTFFDDPFPALDRLRELDPVHQTPIGTWRLSRYDDVVRLLRDVPCGVRTTDGRRPFADESERPGRFMLLQDPPAHTRLRKLVSRAFTPRAVERMRERAQAIVDEQLEHAAQRGTMDLVADLALPVPATVICEMLGVPVEDRDRFTVWTAQATHGLAVALAPPEVLATAMAAGDALASYFVTLIEERRRNPSDDLLSGLIRAEEEGDRLTGEELIAQAIGLLIAGFETTIGLIANGVRALLLRPGELAKLRARPELVASAVEECLRMEGPILLTQRVLHEDAVFGGKTLPRDAVVWAMLAAANRDPARFPEPTRFDVARDPNPHLAFGGGAHLCLGAHLARMEAQTAIGSLVRRFPGLALAPESRERVEWGRSLFRVPGRLPVTLFA
jgi:cytochrome P450